MEKIKYYLKGIVLLISVFLIWRLIVVELFEVRYEELQFIYVIAGTILTVYLYGKRK